MASVSVLGAGTWGIALARMLAKTGHDVTVWSAIGSELDSLKETRKHPKLPQMILPENIVYEKDLETACARKDILLFVVPSVFVRQTAAQAKPFIPQEQIIVDA